MQKISIITAVFNRAATIADAVDSVQKQTYTNIEHVVIDGASNDGTVSILQCILDEKVIFVSEPDNGIYDALNKGLSRATGDIFGFMHSDDKYADNAVLEKVAEAFTDENVDAVYGDVAFFNPDNHKKLVRHYRSDRFTPGRIAWGWMPAHTALFFRREVYERLGGFKTNYQIAADFEFIARAFSAGTLRSVYLPEILVHMSTGGASTASWRSKYLLNKEVLRACRENGIRTNWIKLLSKYPLKMLEFLNP